MESNLWDKYLKSYNVMHKAINLILKNSEYNVSIRPHPHES